MPPVLTRQQSRHIADELESAIANLAWLREWLRVNDPVISAVLEQRITTLRQVVVSYAVAASL